ncbi:hypothetical protein N032_00830 [Pseudomonas syringae pv. pisi str. PP1]|nr:hypothetical protein N032_00830 [Pseudomonas syringae pv. pisi str. PP1]
MWGGCSVQNGVPTRSVGTIVEIIVPHAPAWGRWSKQSNALPAATAPKKALFKHDGTDDAECDVSDG